MPRQGLFSAKIVQTERNETCFNCRAAVYHVAKIMPKKQTANKSVDENSGYGALYGVFFCVVNAVFAV